MRRSGQKLDQQGRELACAYAAGYRRMQYCQGMQTDETLLTSALMLTLQVPAASGPNSM